MKRNKKTLDFTRLVLRRNFIEGNQKLIFVWKLLKEVSIEIVLNSFVFVIVLPHNRVADERNCGMKGENCSSTAMTMNANRSNRAMHDLLHLTGHIGHRRSSSFELVSLHNVPCHRNQFAVYLTRSDLAKVDARMICIAFTTAQRWCVTGHFGQQ